MDVLEQCVLVISCHSSMPCERLLTVMGCDEEALKSIEVNIDGTKLTCYPWKLSTKYYDADFHFVDMTSKSLISADFADTVQAVVLYFDSNCKESFQQAQSWMSYVDQYEPEIKLIACHQANDTTAITKSVVHQWCIENGFELVEVNPSTDADEDDETEDDFKDSSSLKRILQALSAHQWPTMAMKSSPTYKPSAKFENVLSEQFIQDELRRLGISDEIEQNVPAESSGPEPSFEELFSRFSEMKEKASSLNETERRKFAEQTAIAFWNAMGGDEDEVCDLDD
ncbi:Alpha- and gamma-adaptin-binding protein p34 [Halotydeus destructor]|nr:Alpha- and gamma-adaptin-binding protein p34 [Halotydeus destructor]